MRNCILPFIKEKIFFNKVSFLFLLNCLELRRCFFILFSQWTKGYIPLFTLLSPFYFWSCFIVLSYPPMIYIFRLAWVNLSSFWSFFSLGNLCQCLLDFFTSLIFLKLFLSRNLADDRHHYSRLQSQVYRHQSWLWNLKQAWGSVPAWLSYHLRPVLPTLIVETMEIILNLRERVFTIKNLKGAGYHFYTIIVTLIFK